MPAARLGKHVVVQPVADIGDGFGRLVGGLDHLGEEPRVRLGHAPAARAGDQVRRHVQTRQGRFGFDRLVAGDQHFVAPLPQSGQTGDRVGIKVAAR